MRIGAWLTCVCVSVTSAGTSPADVVAFGINIDHTDNTGMTAEEAEGLIEIAQLAVPREPLHWWLAPVGDGDRTDTSFAPLFSVVALHRAGRYVDALPLLPPNRPVDKGAASYTAYYRARTHLRLGHSDVARRQFAVLVGQRPTGYIAEAAMLGEAEAASAAGDYAGAQRLYERLLKTGPIAPDHVWMRLGASARAAGNRAAAVSAYTHVYETFPLSRFVPEALSALRALSALEPVLPGNSRYRAELRRSALLLEARRYEEAGAVFATLVPHATGDERDRLEVRRAICHYYTKQYAVARTVLRPFHDGKGLAAEARFFDLMSARALGNAEEFERSAVLLIEKFPGSEWAEEALNTLATHYIQRDRDDEADAAFRRLLSMFPTGRFAERAAWKVGWRALRAGDGAEAVTVFERAAVDFPRSTYRPAYLYWAARARQSFGDLQAASDRYARVLTDYRYSYYGRLAEAVLDREPLPVPASLTISVALATNDSETESLPPTGALIRALLSAGLFDDAVNEIRYAQHRWGESPALEATLGWIEHQKGDLLAGARAVKRAYPQHVSMAGDRLPSELSAVIFPMGYWSLIREQAARHSLDPYLLAALVAQESGFVPDIRSPAKAVGLMQLIPGTAQRYARKLAIASYTHAHLVRPATNVRLGTAYFADLMREFGDAHLALASYNAGENRVRRWLAERPDLAPDEFVDDIPFPETQDYVKKILGTAENYRRIYAGESRLPSDPDRAVPSLAARRSPASVAPSPHVSARPPAPTVARSGGAKKAAADVATKPGSQPGASKRSTSGASTTKASGTRRK